MSTPPDGLDGDCPPWGEPPEYECPDCHRLWRYSSAADGCCSMDDS